MSSVRFKQSLVAQPTNCVKALSEQCLAGAAAALSNWRQIPFSTRRELLCEFRHRLAEGAGMIAAAANAVCSRRPAEILASEILPLLDACLFLERKGERVLRSRRVKSGSLFSLQMNVSEIRREPFGVVLIVAASNYPLFLAGVQTLQAIFAGNAVLLKPGIGGSACANTLKYYLKEAGLPEGLMWVLPESPEVAANLIECGIDKLVFTGSARVGTTLLQRLAPRATPAVMELSGSDAAVILRDADLDLAAKLIAWGVSLNAGRTCIAPRRICVEQQVSTEFEGRLALEMSRSAKHSLDPASCHLIQGALAEGAHLISGELHSDKLMGGPVALAGIRRGSAILRQDIFAPILSLVTVEGPEEAISVSNESPFALGASIFSRSETKALALASSIRAGVVTINDLIAPTANPNLPFGGTGLSGFGVTRGSEGLLEMTRPKVTILSRGKSRPHLRPLTEPAERALSAFAALKHGRGMLLRFTALRRLVRAARDLQFLKPNLTK